MIMADGTIVNTHPIEKVSNGVAGHNANSIHIAYIGGVDSANRPVDNRTDVQKAAQIRLLKDLKLKFPNANILGHRGFPGVAKACPSFDVKKWLKKINL